MGYAIFRLQKVKSCNAGLGRQKHNTRKTEKEILTLTSPQNRVINLALGGAMRDAKGKTFTQVFKERTQGQTIRKNAVFGYEGILTFSPDAISPADLKLWAKSSMEWAANTFGEDNLVSAQLHLDEATPHIHFMAIPLDDKGHLNARHFTGSIEQMRGMQDSYAHAMEPFGLQRGRDKRITKSRHENFKQWQNEQADKQSRLTAYEAVFGTERDWNIDTMLNFAGALKGPSEPATERTERFEAER